MNLVKTEIRLVFMKRRALIIYMTDSPSGRLDGPEYDYKNIHEYLTSNLGGNWYSNEIIALENTTRRQLKETVSQMADSDYSFVVFSGHGEFEQDKRLQYIELLDDEVSIKELIVNSKRQTIIIDACRGYFSMRERLLEKSMLFSMASESLYHEISTRELFDKKIEKTEEGLTVLYSASENQTALDTDLGAAYISSLLDVAKKWERSSNQMTELTIKDAHEKAIDYLHENFVTNQIPAMNKEKRLRYYPFAVKYL